MLIEFRTEVLNKLLRNSSPQLSNFGGATSGSLREPTPAREDPWPLALSRTFQNRGFPAEDGRGPVGKPGELALEPNLSFSLLRKV